MPASSAAKRILIVDDEPRYVRLLEGNLKTEGYAVSTATDGIQALEVFSAQPADLILLDIMMPPWMASACASASASSRTCRS